MPGNTPSTGRLSPMPLTEAFYQRSTVEVARALLGTLLVRELDQERLSGIIVEVEAYLSEGDAASHSFRGMGKKNRSMYLPAGRLYVYPIHAKVCLNVVTEPEGQGAAVLIRALQPHEGTERMLAQRHGSPLRDLTRGPARLCQALAVDRSLDGIDLTVGRGIWLEAAPPECLISPMRIAESARIGIRLARDLPLRFFIPENRNVSRHTREASRRLAAGGHRPA
ncbi:MAG TPA: DNA-3-methyladenine glycosylase [Pirellulaceae bacterium]